MRLMTLSGIGVVICYPAMLFCQSPHMKDDSLTTFYTHIKQHYLGKYKNIKFKFISYESANKIWESDEITPIDDDSLGYLVRIDYPKHLDPTKMIYCTTILDGGKGIKSIEDYTNEVLVAGRVYDATLYYPVTPFSINYAKDTSNNSSNIEIYKFYYTNGNVNLAYDKVGEGKYASSTDMYKLWKTDSVVYNNYKKSKRMKFFEDAYGSTMYNEWKHDSGRYISYESKMPIFVENSFGSTKPDTVKMTYGIGLSNIKLDLMSTPKGADVYMFPKRLWDKLMSGVDWEKELDSKFWEYKLATSTTNTFVYIDQTVYVVVFKEGQKIQKIRFDPQPESIQKEQQISITF